MARGERDVLTLLQYLITGLLIGGVYALMSVGLALIFGIMKVVNFAQGDFMMLGMYFTYFLYTSYGVHPLLGAVLTIPPFYLLGMVVHRLLLVHVSGRGTTQEMDAQLILTLGLSLVITNGVTMLLGPTPRGIVTLLATEAFHVHGLFLNQARTYAFAVALLVAFGVYLFLQCTDLGKALRAAADEPEAAMYMGISVRRMHAIAFGLGIALTAVAGGLLATFWPIEPNVAVNFIILMFVAVVMGGLGSIPGGFVGGLVIGMVQSLSLLVVPLQLQNVGVFVAFLLLLYLRPQGLFGRRGRTV
jgi:branched-chain amino acid transport system permease protein